MLLGISSFSYGWAVGVRDDEGQKQKGWDAFDLLEQAKKLQVPLLQYGDNLPLDTLEDSDLERLYDRALRDGIRLEVGTRGCSHENILRYLHIAQTLHSPLVRIVTDLGTSRPSLREIAESVRALVPLLEKAQVVLAVENHDRFPAAQIAEMVRSVNNPFFGVCLDTVNSMAVGEGVDAVVRQLAPYTVNLHIKDFTVRRLWHQMGFVIEGCPTGEGLLDIARIVETLRAAGRDLNAVLELWTPPEENMQATLKKEGEWVERSLRYLKPLASTW